MNAANIIWSTQDVRLIIYGALALVLIIFLISLVKFPPFLSILIGSFAVGLGVGLPIEAVGKSFGKGVGDILGGVGLIIALGAMLGAMLAESGAADKIAKTLLRGTRGPLLPWVMAFVAMVIGLPLFFEVGLVLMMPIIFSMARRSGRSVMLVAIPALAGMTTLHALVPPHPGPIIAINALHANLGLTMLIGIAIAIPIVIIAGPLYALWLAPKLNVVISPEMESLFEPKRETENEPSFSASILIVLLPVLLMLGRTCAEIVMSKNTPGYNLLVFLGEPVIALAIAVIAAVALLGWAQGMKRAKVNTVLGRSLGPIAALLLTIGAGGGLKQVLLSGGISDTISKVATIAHMPMLLLAWLIAVALRQATGSATVATTTTAGILAPLVIGAPPMEGTLTALAIGAGSVFFCQVNDAGFWMVHEFFSLNLRQTVMAWSVLQTIVSVVGLLSVLLIWQFAF